MWHVTIWMFDLSIHGFQSGHEVSHLCVEIVRRLHFVIDVLFYTNGGGRLELPSITQSLCLRSSLWVVLLILLHHHQTHYHAR